MRSIRILTLLLLTFSLLFSACDSCGPKEDPFDAAWSRFQPLVINAASDAERVRLLKSFIEEHDGHPKLGPVKKQLETLQANVVVAKEKKAEVIRKTEEEKRANALEVYNGFTKEGSFDAFLHWSIAATLWRGGVSKDLITIKTVEFEDVVGEVLRYEANKNITAITPRNAFIRRVRWIDENIDTKCRVTCQNKMVSTILLPITEAPLFAEDGSVQKAPLEKLLAKIDVSPEAEYGDATIPELYRLVSPGLEQALAVREAIRERGDDTVLTAFRIAKKESNSTLRKWYRAFPVETGMTESFPEHQRRRVDLTLGFWMRRINEGTADPIEAFLKKLKKSATE